VCLPQVKLLKKRRRGRSGSRTTVAIVSTTKTRYSGDCNDVPRSAAKPGSCDLRPTTIQNARHGHPAGRHRPLTGKVHAMSRTAIAAASSSVLKRLDKAYSADTRSTLSWTIIPRISPGDKRGSPSNPRPLQVHLHSKHGSWLNLVEGFFSKLARSVCAISASRPNKKLRDRILTASTSSIAIPSFTLGPTNSTRPLDMIQLQNR